MSLRVEGLSKTFGEKPLFQNLNFEAAGPAVLWAPSGWGKTTLLRCINLLERPTSGTVIVDGKEMTALSEKELRLARRKVTMIFQSFNLLMQRTCLGNVCFPLELAGVKKGPARQRALELLELVGLEPDDRNRLMRGYSHGMKHKIQMLCFLIGRPPVILLDEPLTSFDVVAALEMKNLLREMKGDHIILFSTHILQLAQDLCDEIVLLHQGELEGVDNAKIHTPQFESYIVDLLTQEEDGEEVAP